MKKQILNLGKTLSRAEQQQVNGGSGTCAYYNGVTGIPQYNLSSSAAQGMLANSSDHWCCESCNEASWYNPNSVSKKPDVIVND